MKRVPRKFGIGLALRQIDVVEDPELGVLKQRADAEDVVIAADHPDRAVVLQDAARLGEPFAGEIVIGGEAVELVPLVVDGIDAAAFGPEQVAAKLQIVGRIGEDHVDGLVGEARHFGDAVTHQNLVERKLALRLRTCTRAQSALGLRDAGNKVHATVPPLRRRVSQARLAVKRTEVNALWGLDGTKRVREDSTTRC